MKRLLLLVFFIPATVIAVQGQDCSGADAIQAHIYNPDRLVPTDKGCITVTGRIIAKVPEKDGDFHGRIKLRNPDASELRSNDLSALHNYFNLTSIGTIS